MFGAPWLSLARFGGAFWCVLVCLGCARISALSTRSEAEVCFNRCSRGAGAFLEGLLARFNLALPVVLHPVHSIGRRHTVPVPSVWTAATHDSELHLNARPLLLAYASRTLFDGELREPSFVTGVVWGWFGFGFGFGFRFWFGFWFGGLARFRVRRCAPRRRRWLRCRDRIAGLVAPFEIARPNGVHDVRRPLDGDPHVRNLPVIRIEDVGTSDRPDLEHQRPDGVDRC